MWRPTPTSTPITIVLKQGIDTTTPAGRFLFHIIAAMDEPLLRRRMSTPTLRREGASSLMRCPAALTLSGRSVAGN
jgi:hypothetical protein